MAAQVKIGSIFAGYRVEGVLGRGGMGVVYLAEQPELGRKVAIKVIAPALASDPDYLERFRRESRLAAAIEHPNAIPIYEAGVAEEDMPYLVMRYVEGEDLSSVLRREGRLDPRRAAAIVDQIAGALDEAHARGLVHRDVKPANVIVESRRGTEHAYLTDFGLTREMDASSGVTGTGRWVGTIDYASPEQIQGRPVDARCDVYALGCVLFASLTGRLPFERAEDVAKLYAHVSEPPPKPSTVVPEVPEEIDAVVTRAMAKDPDLRFPSAGDFGRAATSAATGTQVGEPERSVATGEAAPATEPAPPPIPPTKPSDVPPPEPESTVESPEARPTMAPTTQEVTQAPPDEPPKTARAGARRRLAVIGAVLAVGAVVAIVIAALGGGGGGEAKTGGDKGGGGPANEVDGIALEPFTKSRSFTADVPKGSEPALVDDEVGSSVVLTTLITPDREISVLIQSHTPEVAPADAAAQAASDRTGEGASAVDTKHTSIAGHDASLLTYRREDPGEHGLPPMGEVDAATYFFNEGGLSWRTRTAVSTSVDNSQKVAEDLAAAIAASLEPRS
jgi:serine/threonine protein kinase